MRKLREIEDDRHRIQDQCNRLAQQLKDCKAENHSLRKEIGQQEERLRKEKEIDEKEKRELIQQMKMMKEQEELREQERKKKKKPRVIEIEEEEIIEEEEENSIIKGGKGIMDNRQLKINRIEGGTSRRRSSDRNNDHIDIGDVEKKESMRSQRHRSSSRHHQPQSQQQPIQVKMPTQQRLPLDTPYQFSSTVRHSANELGAKGITSYQPYIREEQPIQGSK
ncbi:MAG: hypothetical protein EZS28_022451 [Streblomastix strix]|uniref:Uncharacterized protein n=1 Tax=Streblomastix strix TaxID=222440 RepID=A0A5J4VHG6_9EUKA|nr:MAG: hypothetical protein EZS28_022451 [Streblomastix strix]